mmetsp:Transcript_32165/g.91657  ORF Transcript_32165/g.91657 Transcript_32165/m.91657 type:complete len:211 (+) Transcript_32165:434-1066(+)
MNTSSSDNGPRWSKPLATYKTTVRTTNVQDRETRIAAKVIVTAVHPASAKVSNVSPDTALSHPPPYTSNGSTPPTCEARKVSPVKSDTATVAQWSTLPTSGSMTPDHVTASQTTTSSKPTNRLRYKAFRTTNSMPIFVKPSERRNSKIISAEEAFMSSSVPFRRALRQSTMNSASSCLSGKQSSRRHPICAALARPSSAGTVSAAATRTP